MTQTLTPGVTDAADLTALFGVVAPTGEAIDLTHGAYSWATGVTMGDGGPTAVSTIQNVELNGEVGGAAGLLAPPAEGVGVTYTGAPLAGAMLTVEGPISAAFRNITFELGYNVDTGLDLKHAFNSVLADVNVLHAKKVGIRQGAYPTPTGVYTGASGGVMERVNVSMAGIQGGKAFVIGEDTFVQGLDVSRWSYRDCGGFVADTPDDTNPSGVLTLQFCDNLHFHNFFAWCGGLRHSFGVVIRPPKDGPWYPCEVDFFGLVAHGGFHLDTSMSGWAPDENSALGVGCYPIHTGDMTDGSGGKRAAKIPESRDLGGREGINGFTHTMLFLDRHQLESWRDGKIRYSVSVPDRKPNATSTQATTPIDVWSFLIEPHQLRVFDRTPNANVYRNDRKFRLEGAASLLCPGLATDPQKPLTIRGYYGAACFFDSGVMMITPSPYWRDVEFWARLFARGSETAQGGGAWLEIFKPGSGGGAVAGDSDIRKGHQKGTLSPVVDAGLLQTLRVEVTLAAGMTFNTLFATLETL